MGDVVHPIAFRRVCASCKTKIVWTDDPGGFRLGECDCTVIALVTSRLAYALRQAVV